MFDFTDQIVLVTGAAGNLGSAVAQRFYERGARLVLAERHTEKLKAVFPAIDQSGERLFAVPADLTDPDSTNNMVAQALAHFGPIDIVANTVGGYHGGERVHELSLDAWDFMMSLNARSAFLLAQAVVPHMLERGSGRIINTAARAGLSGTTRHAAYSASKSAVIRLTESLSNELKHDGITINCVLPGTIDTPENREAMPKADYAKWVTPEAIADVFLFLASDAARAVTGAAVPVYGRG